MPDSRPLTFLCVSGYFKGAALIEELKRLGCSVFLVTKEKLKDEPWPRECIEEIFFIPDTTKRPDIIYAVSYLARARQIDRLIALDDYDVEIVAALREHLRVPGMGETTVRYFRDKLAMRVQARDKAIRVPEFAHVLNYDRLREFMARVPAPWVLKPRSEAGAMGIKKIHHAEELWRWLDQLGDQQSFYVLEQFVPGEVFHVDSIIWERDIVFTIASQYGRPPMNVSHEGGVFMTRTLPRDSADALALTDLNRQVMAALNMLRGVTHAEYIKAHADGQLYFLETAARVGGANIAEMVEYASGLNLWCEWAKLEVAQARGETYRVPDVKQDYAGVLQCLAQQEHPNLSVYNDPEVKWRSDKKSHAGLVASSPDYERLMTLLNSYATRFAQDFLAVMPPLDHPPA